VRSLLKEIPGTVPILLNNVNTYIHIVIIYTKKLWRLAIAPLLCTSPERWS